MKKSSYTLSDTIQIFNIASMNKSISLRKMPSTILLLSFLWSILLINHVECQRDGSLRGNRRGKRGPRNRPSKEEQQERFDSLTITFPMEIFTDYSNGGADWKSPAVFSPELKSYSDVDKPYAEFAHAQDQEDVWLYENWFYGMKNGVIMESGALDGMLFSTSFMFEKFANWTALHVGKIHKSIKTKYIVSFYIHIKYIVSSFSIDV